MKPLLTLVALGLIVFSARSAEAAAPLDVLDETIGLAFLSTPLNDAAQFISDLHKIEVELDRAGLKRAGVPEDTPITLRADKVKLKTALTDMLAPLKLTYKVVGDSIVITDK